MEINVYGSGSNSKNQLLLVNRTIIYDVTLIPKLKHIEYICCGDSSSFTLDMDGIMFAFGQNKYACLGDELDGSEYDAPSGFNKISLNDTKIRSIITISMFRETFFFAEQLKFLFFKNTFRETFVCVWLFE